MGVYVELKCYISLQRCGEQGEEPYTMEVGGERQSRDEVPAVGWPAVMARRTTPPQGRGYAPRGVI